MAADEKEYEQRLRRRLEILRKEVEAGKVHVNPDLSVVESLKAVRYEADGSIDLATVDGLVRSLALGVEMFHDRNEIKKQISLNEIQSTYFEFIERQFGQFFEVMRERKLTPHDAGIALSRGEARKEIASGLPDLLNSVKEFWEAARNATEIHLEDMSESLKAVFGGDLFPSYTESIASKCGIYADTIILPDPFLRSEWALTRWSEEQQVYYCIKHGLNLLQYKSLVDANLAVPVIAILPADANSEEKKFFGKMSEPDALAHAQKLFDRHFSSVEEFAEFAEGLSTEQDVLNAVTDPSRLLFDSDWGSDPKKQLHKALEGQYSQLLQTKHAGMLVFSQAIGRMSVSNELLIRSARLRGIPIIDAPTSWQYFNWKLEYDARRIERENQLTNLHVLRGIQAVAHNEMQWLGKIPHDALIEMRKEGALEEIRLTLGAGISELAAAKPTNFYRSADRVFDNIQTAFVDHRKKIDELSAKKWRFAGRDIGTWLAVGTLEVAAAATGYPTYGLAAVAANQLIDAPKLWELPNSIRELAKNSKQLHRSPVGLLFSYSKNL